MPTPPATSPPHRCSSWRLTELVLSPVWVWLVVDEVPTAATLVGGAMILVATAFQASARMPRPVAPGVG